MEYTYTKQVNLDILKKQLEISAITKALDSINSEATALTIIFKASLSEAEELILDSIVNDHVYQEFTSQDPISVVIDDIEVDSQGRQITRYAAGQKGWTYLSHPFEFETSKLGSLYTKNYLNTSRADCTIKFYDVDDVEVTDSAYEADIIKTVLTWSPDYDYELISGSIRQVVSPSTDVRIWVIGGIVDLGSAYVKEFTGGLNMHYLGADEEIKTDGRASKYMKKTIEGVPYNANKLQIIVRHNAGVQHKLMITIEYFRA